MKKRFAMILGVCCMAAFAVSCSKENQVEERQAELANDVIHISANVSFDETKALNWTEDGVTATFGANEYLYVYKEGTFIVRLTNGEDGGSSFEGDIPATSLSNLSEGENSVTLYYLQNNALVDSPEESVFTGLSYATQDGTKEGIAKFDLAMGASTITKSGSTASFASGTITLSAQQAILQVTLSDVSGTSAENFNKLEVSNGATTYTATLASGTNTVFYIAIPASASANYTFLATTGDETPKQYWGYKKEAPDFAKGEAYKTTVKLEKFDEADNVNLGDAGTWKNMNSYSESALHPNTNPTNVTGFGSYYSYAEAASAPTQTQLADLAALDKGWFTLNGVNGRVFGTGSRHIFLPAAGCSIDGDDPDDDETNGYYWSSTPGGTNDAYNLSFDADDAATIGGGIRDFGMSVRRLQ